MEVGGAIVGVAHVPAGVTVGFKALPTAILPTEAPLLSSADADWAGIYPQLSVAQAIAYLPNQFDRGHTSACIVRLVSKQPLVIVTISAASLTDGSRASSTKAAMVRGAINSAGYALPEATPLMNACGDAGIVLCLPDAEGFELVFPKALFTQTWLDSELLFAFQESSTVPSTVGKVEQLPQLHRSVLMDWDELTRALEATLTETQCSIVQRVVHQSIQRC